MARGKAAPPSPQHAQRRTKTEGKHWLEYAIFVFVILTAIATGFAAWYTRQQWLTSADTEKRQLRAYLYATFGPLTNLNGDKPPEIAVHIRLGGETPAYHVKAIVHMAKIEFPFRGDIRTVQTHQPTTTGNMAFCYKDCDMVSNMVYTSPLTDTERKQIEIGDKLRFYVWGEVQYEDTFSLTHYLRFCSIFGGPEQVRNQMFYCDSYNEAD